MPVRFSVRNQSGAGFNYRFFGTNEGNEGRKRKPICKIGTPQGKTGSAQGQKKGIRGHSLAVRLEIVKELKCITNFRFPIVMAVRKCYNTPCDGGNLTMPAKLTAQDIYDKEFTVDARGYSANEVDSYLDQVIEDYQEYEEQTQKLSSALVSCDQKIRELTQENEDLKKSEESLKQQLEKLQQRIQSLQSKAEEDLPVPADVSVSATEETFSDDISSMTLEERVARLEQAVFHSDK